MPKIFIKVLGQVMVSHNIIQSIQLFLKLFEMVCRIWWSKPYEDKWWNLRPGHNRIKQAFHELIGDIMKRLERCFYIKSQRTPLEEIRSIYLIDILVSWQNLYEIRLMKVINFIIYYDGTQITIPKSSLFLCISSHYS